MDPCSSGCGHLVGPPAIKRALGSFAQYGGRGMSGPSPISVELVLARSCDAELIVDVHATLSRKRRPSGNGQTFPDHAVVLFKHARRTEHRERGDVGVLGELLRCRLQSENPIPVDYRIRST